MLICVVDVPIFSFIFKYLIHATVIVSGVNYFSKRVWFLNYRHVVLRLFSAAAKRSNKER